MEVELELAKRPVKETAEVLNSSGVVFSKVANLDSSI